MNFVLFFGWSDPTRTGKRFGVFSWEEMNLDESRFHAGYGLRLWHFYISVGRERGWIDG